MSRYLARLLKLEAAVPQREIVKAEAPRSSLAIAYARVKAEGRLVATATPIELYIYWTDRAERLEKELATDCTNNSPLSEKIHRLRRVVLPRITLENRHQAEIALLRDAGFPYYDYPGAKDYLEDILFAA